MMMGLLNSSACTRGCTSITAAFCSSEVMTWVQHTKSSAGLQEVVVCPRPKGISAPGSGGKSWILPCRTFVFLFLYNVLTPSFSLAELPSSIHTFCPLLTCLCPCSPLPLRLWLDTCNEKPAVLNSGALCEGQEVSCDKGI